MGNYEAMKSGGSFNEATQQDKASRAAEQTDRQFRQSARRAEAMAWVAEHMPESVGRWDSFAAHALIVNDRKGIARSVAAVKRRMQSDDPKAVELIKEMQSEKGATK